MGDMKILELLKTEIPKPFLARGMVVIFLCVAYGALYYLVRMTLYPPTPGETMGEAAISRGGFFIMFTPIVAFIALVVATFTYWQKRHLSRLWVYAGTSPIPALFLGILIVFLFFGKT